MTDPAPFHYDAFISYARKEAGMGAAPLDSALKGEGFKAWRDKRNIDPSADFTAEIEKGMESAARVILCLTPDCLRDNSFVRREVAYAEILHKPVLVARFADVRPPISVVNCTWVDFFKDWDSSLAQLIAWLRGTEPPDHYAAPALPSEQKDSYREYVSKVYARAVDYLNRNIIRQIDLDVEETPEAVPAHPLDMFDLLMSDERTQTPFANFAEAFAHFNQRALLLGEPGAGKTITLMTAARDAAVKRLSDPTAPLPVFGLLSVWDASKQTPLADWLGSYDKLLSAESLRQAMTQGKALLLLDGLDEMGGERTEKRKDERTGDEIEIRYDPRKRFLQTLKAQLGNNHALVTCRIADYAAIGDLAALEGGVTLQKLSDAQLREYLKDLPALLNAIQTDPGLNEIARTPLLLSFFAFAFRDRDDDLQALEDLREGALRDAIFNAYMDKRYAHEERRLKRLGENPPFTLQEIKDALGRVAMENAGGKARRGTYERQVDNVLERRDFVLVLPNDRITSLIDFCLWLQYLQQQENGHFAFIHLLLRDTLVYGYCLPRLRDIELYTKSIEPSPAVALSVIKDWRTFDLLYDLATHITNQRVMRLCAIDGLGNSGDYRAVEILVELMADSDVSIRSGAAKALGTIGDVHAVEPLIQALADSDEYVRYQVVMTLEQLGDVRAVQPIIHCLSDPDNQVRSSAAEALGKLGDMCAIEPLIQALADSDEYVRRQVVIALEQLGDRRAVQPLIRILAEDPAENVRDRAAKALGLLADPCAIQPLIRALTDPEHWVQVYAVNSLVQLGTPAVKPIINLLANSEPWMQHTAAKMLVRLGQASVEPLIQLLTHSDANVRIHVVESLEQLVDIRAIEPLIQALADPDWQVSAHAIRAVSNLGEPAIEPLIYALAEPDEDIATRAADALSRIGKSAVEPLIRVLAHPDARVRFNAIDALEKLGDLRAVEPLIRTLDDTNWGVRAHAMIALGTLRDLRAVEPLIHILVDDPNKDIHSVAAQALSLLGDVRAVKPLINALESSNIWTWIPFYDALSRIGTPEAIAAVEAWRSEGRDDWY